VRDVADHEHIGVPKRYAVARALVVVQVLIFFDLLWGGPLKRIDVWLAGMAISRNSPLRTPLLIPDGIGLRAVTAPLLVVVASYLGWRLRSWRPTVLTGGAVLALNLTVAVIKITTGRGQPIGENPDLFIGGMMWPSGHASNIAMTMTLGLYLVRRYGGWHLAPRTKVLAFSLPTTIMCTTSVICGYHWVSDLIAGVIVGVLVAMAVAELDAHLMVARTEPGYREARVPEFSSVATELGERSSMV
jgi:membrane-associated phospholipid phosphatase